MMESDPNLAKMSDVLLDFAAPLVEGLKRDPDEQELQGVLFFAASVWNLLCDMADDGADAAALQAEIDDFVAEKAKATGVAREELAELIGRLVKRKALYAGDRRRVRDIKTQRRGGKVSVAAAYELPQPKP